MIEYRTSSCHRFGHPDIIAAIDESSHLDPSWLTSFFDDGVANGKVFRTNETVQIGWMLTSLKQIESGALELWEPQFGALPVKWVRGVNNTIRHLILQKSIAELFSREPVFPSFRDAAFVTTSFLAASDEPDFTMYRQQPSGNDSGWRLDIIPGTNSGVLQSLLELSFHHAIIVPFLALPTATLVSNTSDEIVIEHAGRRITSNQNQLLAELHKSKIWT
jgi:hypothetical protein